MPEPIRDSSLIFGENISVNQKGTPLLLSTLVYNKIRIKPGKKLETAPAADTRSQTQNRRLAGNKSRSNLEKTGELRAPSSANRRLTIPAFLADTAWLTRKGLPYS